MPNISSSSSEIDSAEHSEDDCRSIGTTTTSPLIGSTEPEFQYTSKKLRDAQRRTEHDFRSDVVTVPVEGMMQVCSDSTFSAPHVVLYVCGWMSRH